jgi:two-component system KDP operon response regulator KdpE
MKRILIIDDEAQIRRLIEISMAIRGWEVFQSPTGAEGLDMALASKPDVILLDLNLPDMPGTEVLARLREWSTIPVVVISVRDSAKDIVDLLEAGADDYITKPFFTDVLIARIGAATRKRMPNLDPCVVIGSLKIDMGKREVAIDGESVHLTPTEYCILQLLARNAGKIITREQLLKEVWGPSADTEGGNLRVCINALRRKIEANPSAPTLIINEPGVGYRLNDLSSRHGSGAATGPAEERAR